MNGVPAVELAPALPPLEDLLGSVEIRTWMEWQGEVLVGMSATTRIARDGTRGPVVVEPTGVVARYE